MYEYLQIGKIVNTHGLRGEIKLIPLTDDITRFNDLDWVYVETDGNLAKHSIESVKYFKGTVVLKLSDINTIDDADLLKNCFILVDRANAVKLPEDTFFICDLLESTVYDENGDLLGILTDVLQTGANDVYVIKRESGRELLLPALKSVVMRVSPEQKRIDVKVPKGLLEDEV